MFKKGLYNNKTILITGASSGLGKNMAQHYAINGGRIINLSRNIKKMSFLNDELKNINNIDHMYYDVNISEYDDILNVRNDLIKKDILPNVYINNAAGNFLCPFHKLSPNGWNRIIEIVLNGTFNIKHIFGKELIHKKQSGVFLNITTTYSDTGSAMVIPSAVAKSGVNALMKSLAVEWGKHDIRLVGIAPGPIDNTGGLEKLDPLKIFKYMNDYTNPRSRMCNPTEISNLAMFLTSDYADYINGEIIRIDGGELNKNSGQFNFITNIPMWDKII
jgi:NAD(P)-dependent dehydrogenase (short-subunit alcohol dehydrogenase family)